MERGRSSKKNNEIFIFVWSFFNERYETRGKGVGRKGKRSWGKKKKKTLGGGGGGKRERRISRQDQRKRGK